MFLFKVEVHFSISYSNLIYTHEKAIISSITALSGENEALSTPHSWYRHIIYIQSFNGAVFNSPFFFLSNSYISSIFLINTVHNDFQIFFLCKVGSLEHDSAHMFRATFHHVCYFEFIILGYNLPLYHLVSWYYDILWSSLEPAVFIILSNFESPANFVISLIIPFCILFFNMVNIKSPSTNPCGICLKSDHLFTPYHII